MAKIRKINVSEIAGRSPFDNDNNAIMPAGTIVVYEGANAGEYVLRVHDGVTNGGVPFPNAPSIEHNNDINITVDSGDSSSYTWNFGQTGDLTIPGNIRKTTDASIEVDVGGSLGNIEVWTVDELVPPGGVWRLFIDDVDYPTLGTTVQIGDTVTTSWGTPITATITDIQQDNDQWQIHVDQDITAEFANNDTVTFSTVVTTKTWTFGQDGSLQIPGGITGNNDINITVDSDDSSAYTWNFGQTGVLTAPGTAIFNGTDGIVVDNLNPGIAALFNNGDVYITGAGTIGFTGLGQFDGNSTRMLRFWNAEGRHSTDNDTTELVELRVGNDAAEGSSTRGFFKIRTEKQNDPNNEKEWKFDADGVLTLPAGGDIVDSTGASVLGSNNIWVETFTSTDPEESIVAIATSVEYDAAGNIFALFSHFIPGMENETYASVAKLTSAGAILWQVRFSANLNTDGWGLAYADGPDSVYIAGSTAGPDLDYRLATLTKIDAADGTIVWNKTYDFGSTSRSAVVDVDSNGDPIMVGWADTPQEENNRIITTKVDQEDGSVVWSRSLDGQGDDAAYGMAVGPADEVVTIGYIDTFAEVLSSYPVTPLTGSGVNVLVINRSDLSNDTFTDSWTVAGTGITGTIGVNQINAYTNLTGTVQQGSGAVFEIADNGDNTYVISGLLNGGTNYLPGHKILVLGTALGGATPANDCIVTVDDIDPGGIIWQWSVTGVAAGAAFNIYTPLTGTNYQTGSGLEFDLELDSSSTYTEHPFNINVVGSNYVDGDVVVIPGTQLGGTSPANDLTITVSASAGSVQTFNSFTGTQQTTTYRIRTANNGGVDFSGVGTWTLNDISIDTDDRMVVVKYASDGTIAWQKAVEFDANYDCKGADADIDSDGNIYVCGNYNNFAGQAMSLVKFNSSGVKQWSRQVIGNCQDFATSVVVGPDNNLYLSGVTTDNANQDTNWVVAKYSTGGSVVWQRLINNTAGWTFAGGTFIGDGGGSNIDVRNGYVALGGGFGNIENNEDPTAAVVQIDTAGTTFSIGDWDFTAAQFSGTLDDTASNITVVDAGMTSDTVTPAVADFVVLDDDSNFLTVTRYSPIAGDNSLVNGAYSVVLGDTGTLTLPAGGTITEGYVTSNPTIQLTPASPTVASQKLVIKGGAGPGYSNTDNGITINYDNNTAIVGDTLTFNINSDTYAGQTLYWWIYPEGAGIGDSESGTVVLSGSSGSFSILIDSDDYEFTVRVSPEDNNYDPASLGVETGLINDPAPTFDVEHHLHLTTGNLAETSIILGTDNHNVRTTVNGGVEINTFQYPSGGGSGKWTFSENGDLTFPDATVQTTAYIPGGGGDATGVSRSDDNLIIRLTDPQDDGLELRSIVVDSNDMNVSSTVLGANGFVISTNSNVSQQQWQFDNDGDITLPAGGNVVDSEGVSQLANRVEGSWTLPDDSTDTYSFTVPADGTYIMWVKGNIPNGIITWNATASVSNTNVPAIGTQYAWNYTGGGSPILLTSIPNQIKGVAGTISTDNTYVGSTSNRFDFGISNTSGAEQTVYYGYTKIS